jgi:hypothetical protein
MSDKSKPTSVEECHRRAAIARQMADAARCLLTRAYFLELEERWHSRGPNFQPHREPKITLALGS